MNRQDQIALESRVAKLEAENADLRVTVATATAENAQLVEQIKVLRADFNVLQESVLMTARSDAAPVEKRGPGRPRKWS